MPTDYTPDITQNPAVMQMLQQLTQGQAPPPSPGFDLQALMQRAAQVQPQTLPVDTGVPDKADWGSKIILGLADAMQAYAHGRNPNVPVSNFTANLYEKIRQNRLTKAENERRTGEAKVATERNLAGMQLDEIRRKDEAKARAEEKQAREQERRDALASQEADRKAARDLQVEIQKMKGQQDLAVEKARGEFQSSIARINANQDKTAARMDKKELGQAMEYVNTLAEMAPQMLAQGATAEQIKTRARRHFDSLVLSDDSRKAADAYFQSEIVPMLIEYQNQALAAGSPQMPEPPTQFETGMTQPSPAPRIIGPRTYGR